MKYNLTRKNAEPVKALLALDKRIAREFHSCAVKTKEYPNNYGEMSQLRMELQALCGITELEALNVLAYRNVSDYIRKYNNGTVIGIGQLKNRPAGYIESETE